MLEAQCLTKKSTDETVLSFSVLHRALSIQRMNQFFMAYLPAPRKTSAAAVNR